MFSAATKSAAAASPSDPYFDYVTMLLPGNGTNGAQNNTFLDSSTNNLTITRNGNTTQGTFSPYGANWSNYFDGTGDYATVPDNANLRFGTSPFTVEAWIYITVGGQLNTIVSKGPDSAASGWVFRVSASNVLEFVNTTTVRTDSRTLSVGVWYHVAAIRNSSNELKISVNGVLSAALGVALTQSFNDTNPVAIAAGRNPSYQNTFNGYISNLRFNNGTAVYTSNFTPSTVPLTAISGTCLLTCQSNRFIDNSSNNFTLTVAGNTSVQKFSPFNPITSYNASTIGGSGYFDGSTDFITSSSNAAFNFGSGNYTIEGWHYLTAAASSTKYLFDFRISASGDSKIAIYITSNFYAVYLNGGYLFTGGNVISSAWVHFALVKNNNVTTLYINGNSVGSAADNITYTQGQCRIGSEWSQAGAYDWQGYISNFRVTKSAVYTAAFTVPSEPVTAIANTSFLVNFTNAGIIDNAMMNNWETVGTAQISTSTSQFGGGSIFVDGSANYITCPVFLPMLGSGNWTIEMWLRSGQPTMSLCGQISGSNNPWCIVFDAGALYFQNNTQVSNVLSNINVGSLLDNNWHHLAIVKNSGTTTCYVDGVNRGSGADSTNYASTNPMKIGGSTHSSYFGVTARIDDFRITKGYARYTANFTPTGPFPTR